MFSSIWEKLAGWKVNGLATGFIVCVLVEKLLGVDIPGFDPGVNWVGDIFGGLLIMAGRSTVKSVTGK